MPSFHISADADSEGAHLPHQAEQSAGLQWLERLCDCIDSDPPGRSASAAGWSAHQPCSLPLPKRYTDIKRYAPSTNTM